MRFPPNHNPKPAYYATLVALGGLPTPTPTPTPKPSATPTQTPLPAGVCSATYKTVNEWPGGFQAEVTVKNNGTSTQSKWSVSWTFPGGRVISRLWNGVHTQSGSSVTVKNESYNGTPSIMSCTAI
ncbi:cellulose binding domain-containing protein [Sphaerimonospora sp. CA-214678]|uniref:cellulose binding domain-containing protein n=1 Tax=Sphaerimonospora sp. CA-214678 TaxID=3240029 RepID=UPI003D92BAC5